MVTVACAAPRMLRFHPLEHGIELLIARRNGADSASSSGASTGAAPGNLTRTSRSSSGNDKGRSASALNTANTAVAAPRPSASDANAGNA